MNAALLASLLALLVVPAPLAQPLAWVRPVGLAGQGGQSAAWDVAVGADGAVYSVGSVAGGADFDGDGVADHTADYESPVLLRHAPDGRLTWSRVIRTNPGGQARAVALDGNGGLYVTGYLSGTADFDGDGTPEVQAASAGYVFVAHYGTDGAFRWVRGTCGVRGEDVAVDPTDGSVVAVGFAGACSDFDRNGAPDPHAYGLYVVRYGADGQFVWARLPRRDPVVGGSARASVAVSATGDVYVGGTLDGSDTPDFDGDGTPDAVGPLFFARFDPDGIFQWARSIPTDQIAEGLQDVAVVGDALYVAGAFVGAVDFSGDGAADLTATPESAGDFFVARYTTGGAFRWARGAGSGRGGLHVAHGLAADSAGVYAAGSLAGRVDVDGDGQPDAPRGLNLFVVRYAADGAFERVRTAAGVDVGFTSGTSQAKAVAVGPGGRLHVAGLFTDAVDFSGDGAADAATPSFAWFTAQYGPVTTTAASAPRLPGPLTLRAGPNPFGPAADVVVSVPDGRAVRVEVFDVLGRRVRVLHDGPLGAGRALRLDGSALAPGVYLVCATDGATRVARRLLRRAAP